MSGKESNYEHILMCLICRCSFDEYEHQPKFLICHHTFCKDCLREYVKQSGEEIECPSCRKITSVPTAGVPALQTNFYVRYIQSLVAGSSSSEGGNGLCSTHSPLQLISFCAQCQTSLCSKCLEQSVCDSHSLESLNVVMERSKVQMDTYFDSANSAVHLKRVQVNGYIKNLSEEKDNALKKIDSTFEGHVHTLNRRATLLKNKVIAIYNEELDRLECDLDEISTAMTCLISIKDLANEKISIGELRDLKNVTQEMLEVGRNIDQNVSSTPCSIKFDEQHGADKLKASVRDIGRVWSDRNSRATPASVGGQGSAMQSGDSQSQSPLLSASAEDADVLLRENLPASSGDKTTQDWKGISEEQQNVETKADKVRGALNEAVTATAVGCSMEQATNQSSTHSYVKEEFDNSTMENVMVTSERDLVTDAQEMCTDGVQEMESVKLAAESLLHCDALSTSNKLPEVTATRARPTSLPILLTKYKRPIHPNLPANGAEENGKMPDALYSVKEQAKRDKDLYRLMVTSYDEEELLKEFKAQKSVALDY